MSEFVIASDRQHIDPGACYDRETGILDRRIFADDGIYREELTRIFGRAWNFMCHEFATASSRKLFHELYRRG